MAHAGVAPVSGGASVAREDERSLRRTRWYRQTAESLSEDSEAEGPLNDEFPRFRLARERWHRGGSPSGDQASADAHRPPAARRDLEAHHRARPGGGRRA